MAIQRECYHQLEPEPLEVMSNKAELAPACCWVAERQGKVLGYLLCHPWRAHCPPPLSQPLQPLTDHEEFYLHDVDRIHVGITDVDRTPEHRIRFEQLGVPGHLAHGRAGTLQPAAQVGADRLPV